MFTVGFYCQSHYFLTLGWATSDISVRNWIMSALLLKAFILIQASLDFAVPMSKVVAVIADLGYRYKFWGDLWLPSDSLPLNASWYFSLDALFWPHRGSGVYMLFTILFSQNKINVHGFSLTGCCYAPKVNSEGAAWRTSCRAGWDMVQI